MLPRRTVQQIEHVLRGLTYGSVQLVIHDGQIVRIERVERTRLTVSPEASYGQEGQPTDSSEGRREES